jgi:hypothetical protein
MAGKVAAAAYSEWSYSSSYMYLHFEFFLRFLENIPQIIYIQINIYETSVCSFQMM